MVQRPGAVGLLLCEKAIIEEGTRNVTLVNSFYRLFVAAFPSPPQRFTVHALLTDGRGEVNMGLLISRLDTMEVVHRRSWRMRFTNPLQRQRSLVRTASCSFPNPGRYLVELTAEGEPIADAVLDLVRRTEQND